MKSNVSSADKNVRIDVWRTKVSPRVTVVCNMITPYTNNLYNKVTSSGLPISVITCSKREPNRQWEVDNINYPMDCLPGLTVQLANGRYAHLNRKLWRTLDRHAPDVVLINGFYPTMLSAALWARVNNIPMGLTIDGWSETMPKTIYHSIFRNIIINDSKVIITPGIKGENFFLSKRVPADKIIKVPLIPAWPAPAIVNKFSSRPYHVLWCAHLNDYPKNFKFFAQLAEQLSGKIPDLRVRIVGSGDAESEMHRIFRALKIEYRHDRYVEWQEMPSVYASARALVFPSLWEPWGLVCDEALINGVPCVVSPHVGAGDDAVLTGKNGAVLDLELDKWSNLICEITTDENLWKKMSDNARCISEQRSLSRSADAFSFAIDKALE